MRVEKLPDNPERLRALLTAMSENMGVIGLRLQIVTEGSGNAAVYMTHTLGPDDEARVLSAAVPALQAAFDASIAERAVVMGRLRDFEDRHKAVMRVLETNGCECGPRSDEDHEDDCEMCLACRVESALKGCQ